MPYDYAPVGIDDDEEERKFPFPPVSPFGAPQSAYSDMPPVASSAPPVSPAPADLSSQLSRPEESAINSPMPAAPPVSHPAQERLKALEAQGPPPVGELHGGKKVLDTLGKIFTPNLEQAIRYGPQLKYERQRNQALGDVKAEQEPEESQAKVEQQKALAEQEQARAEALKNPPVKPKEEVWKTVPGMVGPKGQVLQEEQNSGQIRWAPGIEGAGPLKEPTPNEHENDINDYLAANNLESTPANREKARKEIALRTKNPPAEPGNYVPVPDAKGNTIGWVDPKSGHYRSVASIVGLGTAVGGSSIAQKPTTQERNVSAQAEQVLQGIPDVLKEIDTLKGDLGPVGGRFNEFMQGKVGTNDPKFAGLRADLLMLSSAVALMHARGRLPENLREEFDNAINAPKQTAENLRATIEHVQTWAQRASQMGQSGGEHKPTESKAEPDSPQPQRPANVPDGYVHIKNGPKGSGWYKP